MAMVQLRLRLCAHNLPLQSKPMLLLLLLLLLWQPGNRHNACSCFGSCCSNWLCLLCRRGCHDRILHSSR